MGNLQRKNLSKKERLHKIIILLLLIIIFAYHVVIFEKESLVSDYYCTEQNGEMLIVNEITENVLVKGRATSMDMWLSSDTLNTNVEIEIIQDDKNWSYELVINSCEPQKYTIQLNVKEGDFVFKINNVNSKTTKIMLSDSNSWGTNICLGLQYEIRNYKNIRIFLYTIFLILGLLCIHIAQYDESKLICNILWILTTFWVLCSFALKFPAILISGSEYYEIGGLYIEKSLEYGWNSIGIGDAGYLPLASRLIIILITRCTNSLDIIIYTAYWITAFLVALICTFFLIYEFKSIMSLQYRFGIVILIGMGNFIVRNEQMITLLNFSYFACVMIILFLLMDMETIRKRNLILICLTNCLVVSKAVMLAFVPALIFLLIYEMLVRHRNKSIYILTILIAEFIQILFIINNSMALVDVKSESKLVLFIRTIKVYLELVGNIIFEDNVKYIGRCVWVVLGTWIVLNIYNIYRLYRKNKESLIIYLVLLSASFGSILMDLMSKQICINGMDYSCDFPTFNLEWYTKNCFFVICFCMYSFVVFAYNAMENKGMYEIIALLIVTSFAIGNYKDDLTDSIEGGGKICSISRL